MLFSSRQSGNVLFLILIAVALFAALGFAVSQSSRTGGKDTGSREKTELGVAEVLSYANEVANAVQYVMIAKGCSDTQLSFDETKNTSKDNTGSIYNYTNFNSPSDKSCHIFNANGGRAIPRLISKSIAANISDFPSGWMHPQSWYVIPTRVKDIGTDTGAGGTDLIMEIGQLKKEVCIAINNKLGIPNPGGNPPYDEWDCNYPHFTGSYNSCSNPIGDSVAALAGQKSFCVSPSNSVPSYHYVQVLLAR